MGLLDLIFPPKPKPPCPVPAGPTIGQLFDRVVRFQSNLEQSMSALSEKIDALSSAIDAEREQVTTAVQALKDEIAALKDQLAQGGVTEGDLTRLDDLANKVLGIYEPDVAPEPEPTPEA